MHIPLAAVQHPSATIGDAWLVSIVGARLTVDNRLEWATRSLRLGDRYRTLDDGLRAVRVHTPGDEVWETSRHQLRKFIHGRPIEAAVAEMLGAAHRPADGIERAARRADTIDSQIEDWIAQDAKVFGEVRIGGRWFNSTPGRDLPDYAVLPDGATSTDAADALHARLLGADDVAGIDRTEVACVVPEDLPGETGTLVERWDLHLQDWDDPTITIRGVEVWAYGDGEVGIRARHVDGLKLERR